MTEYRFLRPLDVLFSRGNRLFGDPGAHGEALMPPWPSLAAGALRSRMLVDGGVSLPDFAKGAPVEGPLGAILGTPDRPGRFRIVFFGLGRETEEGVEPLLPVPADLFVPANGGEPRLMRPRAMPGGIVANAPLPNVPILRTGSLGKAATGQWIGAAAFSAYLAGSAPSRGDLVDQGCLWRTDPRIGIALDGARRTAAKGHIYTAEAIAMTEGTGFVVGVDGADGHLPAHGLLRFGGDGRAVAISARVPAMPELDWARIARERRFRLVLATPGLFEDGWRPSGTAANGAWRWRGLGARLVAAAVPRAGTVSGWDLAKRAPKPSRRVAPTGAVYWFDDYEGDIDGLRALVREGLWPEMGDVQRQAEGFNRVTIAAWPRDGGA